MPNIERIVTSGTFELDGGSWDVDNNVWLVGDESDVVVFDAAHSAEPIVAAVRGRNVNNTALCCARRSSTNFTRLTWNRSRQ